MAPLWCWSRQAVRNALLAIGVGLALLGAGGLANGWIVLPFALWMLGAGALLVIVLAYERVRYKPLETARPGPSWERTTERFIDDESGKTVTVYIFRETGERMYVEE